MHHKKPTYILMYIKNFLVCRFLRCQNHQFCDGTAQVELNDLDVVNPISPHTEDLCPEDENALIISRFTDDVRDAFDGHWYELKTLYNIKAAL